MDSFNTVLVAKLGGPKNGPQKIIFSDVWGSTDEYPWEPTSIISEVAFSIFVSTESHYEFYLLSPKLGVSSSEKVAYLQHMSVSCLCHKTATFGAS